MKKKSIVFSLLLLLFVVGCSSKYTDNKMSRTGNLERDRFRFKMGKDKIKGDTLYNDVLYKKIPPMELRRFDTIEESLSKQYGGNVGFKGQEIIKMIHTFQYNDGTSRIIFLSKDEYTNEVKLYVDMIHYDEKQKKYSDIFNVEPPRALKKDRPVFYDTDQAVLTGRWHMNIMKIPDDIEPNEIFGFTTRKKSVETLKIENQKPDEIIQFSNNGIKYYFWYYKDLKTTKEPNDYKVVYEGKEEEYK